MKNRFISNRNIFLILFGFLSTILTACDSQQSDSLQISEQGIKLRTLTNAQTLCFRGKVKTIKQEEFFASGINQEIGYRTGEDSYVITFDKRGNKIQACFLNNEGFCKETAIFNFGQNGKVTGNIIKNNNGDIIKTSSYEYDNYGRIVKYYVTMPLEKLKMYSISTYDNFGNELSDKKYSSKGEKVMSAKNTYKQGALVKRILFDHFDMPHSIGDYTNNKFGDPIKEVYYTGNNLLFEKYHIEYVYDNNNNWIEKKWFLDEKIINSVANTNKIVGIQTVTLRTITYH